MIIISKNRAYTQFYQCKVRNYNSGDLFTGDGHGCLIKAAVYANPCVILRLEFDENLAEHPEHVKMTAVRVSQRGHEKTSEYRHR